MRPEDSQRPSELLRRAGPPLCSTLLLVLLLAACGTEPSRKASSSVRDSAGVAIVENHGQVSVEDSGWRLSDEPVTVIGSFDGSDADQLYQVQGAVRLPDGRIAVGNAGSREVRIYGLDGGHLRSLGGDGEGPGEFNTVLLVGRYGDSLVVMDRRLRRVSILHPDEGFVRSFTPEASVGGYLLGAWFFQDGVLLVRDLPLDDESVAEGFHRTPLPLRTCDMEGSLLHDLGLWPGTDQVVVTRETEHGLATILQMVPFGRASQVAVAGDRMYFGSQDSYEVGVYTSDGTLTRLVRLDRAPVPVSDADLAAFIQDQVEDLEEDEARDRRRELEGMPRMEIRPPYGTIRADAQGDLFVEEYPIHGGDLPIWNVFDPQGRLTGRLRLPRDLEVLEIGEDYLLGLIRDELGVEYVHLYRLERPEAT